MTNYYYFVINFITLPGKNDDESDEERDEDVQIIHTSESSSSSTENM